MLPQDIKTFFRWLEIREAHGIDLRRRDNLYVDADHSALLHRLLEGKEPFEEPPPCAYSYPWYELLENGKASAIEVYPSFGSTTHLAIEQNGSWVIQQELAPECWTARYLIPDTDAIMQARIDGTWSEKQFNKPRKLSSSLWNIFSPGPHPNNPERKIWTVERVR